MADGGRRAELAAVLASLDGEATTDLPDPRLVTRGVALAEDVAAPNVRASALHHLAYFGLRADSGRFGHLRDRLAELDPSLVVEPAARVHGLLARAGWAALDGDLDRAAGLAADAYAAARDEDVGEVPLLRAARSYGAFGGDLAPHRAGARAALAEAVEIVGSGGHDQYAPLVHATLGNLVWAEGDLPASAAHYRAAREAAERVGLWRWIGEAEGALTHISADCGDVPGARRHLQRCIEAGDRYRAEARAGRGVGGTGRLWVSTTMLRARIAFADGDDEAAVTAWRAEVVHPDVSMFARSVSAMDGTVAALAVGDDSFVAEAADELRGLAADGIPMSLAQPLVLGAAEGDLARVEQGVAIARRAPVYGLGKALEIAGLLARRQGDDERAVTHLHAAHDLWSGAGAEGLAARTAAWLRDLGVQLRGPVADRPVTGWGSLTDAERRVAEHVASGALYREIAERLHVSRRTVETHVASATRKLGLRTRGELAAAWFREHEGQDP